MTSVTTLPLLKILKSCLLQRAFGRVSYQPKRMQMSVERTWHGREADSQTGKWKHNERQRQSEDLTMQGVTGLYAGRVETFQTIFQHKLRGTNIFGLRTFRRKINKFKEANKYSFCIATEKYLFSAHVLKYFQNI